MIEGGVIERLLNIERKIEDRHGPTVHELTETASRLREDNSRLQTANEGLSAEVRSEKQRAQKELKRIRDELRDCESTTAALKSEMQSLAVENEQLRKTDQRAVVEQLHVTKAEVEADARMKLESLGIELTKAKLDVMHFQIENSQLLARVEKQNPEVDSHIKDMSECISQLQRLIQCSPPPQLPPEQSLLSGDEDDMEEELIVEVDEQSPVTKGGEFRASFG